MTPRFADSTSAERFVSSLDDATIRRYEQYFDSIRPQSPEDKFRRALFAFASVHTTWRLNCALYEQLYPLDWINDKRLLLAKISESGAGLTRNRTEYIWRFRQQFFAHPEWFDKQEYEDWFQYRDRIKANVKGLGFAKSAFFSELMYFQDSRIACFDVHMVKEFGLPSDVYAKNGVNATFIQWCEREWARICAAHRVSPVTARWCLWDKKQGRMDSRYWSKVLEGDPCGMFCGQLSLFPMDTIKELVA